MMTRARSWHIPLSALGPIANLVIRYGVALLVQAVVFSLAISWLVEDSPPPLATAIVVVVGLAVLNTVLQPVLTWIAVRLTFWLFPFVSFLLTGGIMLLVTELATGWQFQGIVDAGILVGIMTGTTTLVGSLLSIGDDRVWSHFALRPLRSRYGRTMVVDTAPGFVFLEIDGLSIDVLRFAKGHGYVPNLAQMIDTGSHQLVSWECDLSSQTGASQAGILQGTNHNLPAYRWYDKELGRVVVSTIDAHILEQRLSTGGGLLARSGASRGNLFSGDAPDSLFTFSTIRGGRSGVRSYYFYFASTYNVARTAALFLADVLRELVAATWQLLRNERPRVRRFGFYPIVRAATTSLLREMSTFTVAGDVMRGVPAIYTTYIAYDEVAHHSGIARGDALRVLRDIDRDIGRLRREVERAPRPYHLIVLSDHGQSQGSTFRQRFGETLGEHVQRLIAGEHDATVHAEVQSHVSTDEGWQAVSAVVSELTAYERRRLPEPVRRRLREQVTQSEVELEPETRPRIRPVRPSTDGDDVIVVASGNLGLISFPEPARRLTLEEIDSRYPALIAGLVLHPGIGFVMIRSATRGPIVLGNGGAYLLETDEVIGENPLAGYGPNAAAHLRRTDGFDNVPDIVVNSTVNPETGEVFAFEELVGSHGGLGGPQTRPFVLFPAEFALDVPEIVGAEAVYRQFRTWMDEAAGESREELAS